MSYTLPPSVTSLLAAIDAGDYLTPSAREAAIRQAGGPDFVQLAILRKWLDASGGTVVGGLTFKGSTDASGNPNYTAASLKGDAYLITVAGKIGGASGKVVEVGDLVIADADNAGGTEASVGTSWFVLQANITGITTTGLALVRAADAAAALAVTGGIGGSTGATDLATLVADGTGAKTTKSIPSWYFDGSANYFAGANFYSKHIYTSGFDLDLGNGRLLAIGYKSTVIAIKTTTYSVGTSDHTLVGNAPSTPFTITLPAASTNSGRILEFKNKGAAAVTLDATALGQIFTTSLVNTVVLSTGDACTLQSDGTNWLLS
jgi:hypothetical protein